MLIFKILGCLKPVSEYLCSMKSKLCSVPLAGHLTVEFESAQTENVRAVRVLAQLHHAEEPVTICTELLVHHGVDRESERATLLTQFFMLVVQCMLADIELVRLVDANIEHVPLEAFDGAF